MWRVQHQWKRFCCDVIVFMLFCGEVGLLVFVGGWFGVTCPHYTTGGNFKITNGKATASWTKWLQLLEQLDWQGPFGPQNKSVEDSSILQ